MLAPGGHYLLSFWDAVEFKPFARIWRGIMLRLFPDNPPPFVPFEYRFDAARASLLAAGFDGIEASVVRLSREIASPEALSAEFGTDPCRTDLQATFAFDFPARDITFAGPVAWAFAEGMLARHEPDGSVTRRVSLATCIFEQSEAGWRWRQFFGSEPC